MSTHAGVGDRQFLPSGVKEAASQIDPGQRADLLLRDLRSSRSGLSPREAQRRLDQYGPNEIHRREGAGHAHALAQQFTHPLALLLWAAAVLALLASIAALAAAIVAVIVLNAVFAFAQELQAERATEALQQMLPPRVRVRRAGRATELNAAALVPGDVLLIAEGDRLCADARMLSGSVEVDMASLTGESQPVQRSGARTRTTTPLLEAEDLVFSGTLCTSGEAETLVYATGMSTQLGRIAALSQRLRPEISPLQQQVNRAAQLIALVAVGAGVAFRAGRCDGCGPAACSRFDVRDRIAGGQRAGGAAAYDHARAGCRRAADGQAPRACETAHGGRDARLHRSDLYRQDRDADRGSDGGARPVGGR